LELKEVTVSVIIPCYNEVSTIEQIIRAVLDSLPRDKEIVIVDDG
jgi:glycosyltransferase involved in cell wall biosynthesis